MTSIVFSSRLVCPSVLLDHAEGNDYASLRPQARRLPGRESVLHGGHGSGAAVHKSPAKGIQIPESGKGW